MPPNMLCWQKPIRLGKDDKSIAGFTRWTSYAVRKPATKSWMSADARVEFMRAVDEDAVGELKRAARPVTSPEAFDVRADAREE